MRHGWFIIPGVQDGDRTLEEQIKALQPAVDEARGKRVLDLGCAEGLIGREFARAGAIEVIGVDSIGDHLEVARKVCADYPVMKFEQHHLNDYAANGFDNWDPQSFDIVIACGIAHKLNEPSVAVRFSAWCAKDLVLMRCGRGQVGKIIRSKYHASGVCDSHAIMDECGFALEKVVAGHERFAEDVEYWRRK